MTGGLMITAPFAFEYSVLEPNVAATVQQTAERIRGKQRDVISNIISIGADLIRVKEMVGHGNFGPWLAAEFAWDERTARRYMAAAAAFEGKSDIVSVLSQTTLYALAAPSTPAAVREDVVRRLDAGQHVDAADIDGKIREARERAKMERVEAKLTAKQRKARERQRQRKARKRKGREREAEQVNWQERRQKEEIEARTRADVLFHAIGRDAARLVVAELHRRLDSYLVLERLHELVEGRA